MIFFYFLHVRPLQRTALIYLFVAINVLVFHKAIQRIVVFAIFGFYIGMMYGFPVPDFETDNTMMIPCGMLLYYAYIFSFAKFICDEGRAVLSKECNVAGWIDRQIFSKKNM